VDAKPKDDDFKIGPAGSANYKVGEYEFGALEQLPGPKVDAPRLTTVTLIVSKGGKEVWRRELAGNPWSDPIP
jgi:hypothetical protein